jgi:hypothetical protein
MQRFKDMARKVSHHHDGQEDREYKFTCSFCEVGCDEAYVGLKPVLYPGGQTPPNRTHACRKCYLAQFSEAYPGESLPTI